MYKYKQDFIIRCWPFLLVFVCYIVVGLGAQSYLGKNELHLLLVTQEHPVLDSVFRMVTELGDLPFAVIVAGIIWWRYRRIGLGFYVSAALMQLIIVQGIKHLFFSHHLRPIHYFHEIGIYIYSMPSVDQGMYFHFPSGHTAMTFVAFLALATLSQRRWWQFVCAFLAVLVAYSRLYLAQHFMLDTVAGAVIGVLSVVVSYYFWQAHAKRIEQNSVAQPTVQAEEPA